MVQVKTAPPSLENRVWKIDGNKIIGQTIWLICLKLDPEHWHCAVKSSCASHACPPAGGERHPQPTRRRHHLICQWMANNRGLTHARHWSIAVAPLSICLFVIGIWMSKTVRNWWGSLISQALLIFNLTANEFGAQSSTLELPLKGKVCYQLGEALTVWS